MSEIPIPEETLNDLRVEIFRLKSALDSEKIAHGEALRECYALRRERKELVAEVERLTKELSLEKDKAECSQKNYEEAARLWHEAGKERDELAAWKESALAVEQEWDEQKLAMLLGAPLGVSCRKYIGEAVPKLLDRIAQLEAALTKLSTINRNNVNCLADYVVKVAMKALSAPADRPSELEGIKSALKDVVEVERPIPQEDEWKCRLIDALIVRHLYRKEHDSDPVLAIDDLISWEIKVACDPLVNGGRVLIPQEVVQKMAGALERIDEAAEHSVHIFYRRVALEALALYTQAKGQP